jgi:cellulose biosynthesis protein BcsQ
MKTLSIISHKGGAGKTASAVILAEEFAAAGVRVVLVDADRQRGAGLILGVDANDPGVQQTRTPRLRYFCSSHHKLRDLTDRYDELAKEFQLAVVDTPSLDDPLARKWLQLSSHALLVLPVEPVSVRTLDAAELALQGIRSLNGQIHIVGMLPTLFDAEDPTQRSLYSELQVHRSDWLLAEPIPLDPGIAHRAEQDPARRSEPSEESRAAYRKISAMLSRSLGLSLQGAFRPAAAMRPAPAAEPVASPPREPRACPTSTLVPGRTSPRRWALAALLVVVLAALAVFVIPGLQLRRPADSGKSPAVRHATLAARRSSP